MAENVNVSKPTDTKKDEFAKLMLGTAAGFAATLLVVNAYDKLKLARTQSVETSES